MAQNLADAVRAAGVVGAGGAGFPTHVKLAANVDTVIANGAECDPLLQCDQRLIESRAGEIIRGVQLAMEATGASRGILALKDEYHGAASALKRAIRSAGDGSNLSLLLMESRYPAGDEFVLVYEATGRLVPETGLPLHVGCLVQNVQTLFNIARAAKGAAVTHRLLTVVGAVARPVTLWAPVGTAIGDVLAWAGGVQPPRWSERTADDYAVVVGGPMMGTVAGDLTQPVTKMTSGLLVLPRDNAVVRYMDRPRTSWVRRGMSTCDQCRDCTDLCPRYLLGHELEPHEVMRAINYGQERPSSKVTAAVLCCECRLCEAYACPLELSPMAYYVTIKQELRAQGWRNEVHNRTNLEPHSMREYRLVPTHRLIARLGLTEWGHQVCPLDEAGYSPKRVSIPLQQHIGAPARPVVGAGDKVSVGDLIAEIPQDALGANIHASIAGRVRSVDEASIEIVA
ncbi:MAG: 4Fe-4S dicluster domain-containing protein [Anaerolineae bacterium]|jgi:Na+-translocating ferredoxin:NAD+ oxidoreductase RnfC subunit